jgi:hypothetical protein
MSYTLNMAGGSAPIMEHRLTVYELGTRAIVTLEVVDDEETTVAAFSYVTEEPLNLDHGAEYVEAVSKLYEEWQVRVGATKTDITRA